MTFTQTDEQFWTDVRDKMRGKKKKKKEIEKIPDCLGCPYDEKKEIEK